MKVRKPVRARQIKSKQGKTKIPNPGSKSPLEKVERQLSRVVLKFVYGPGCQTNGADHL